MQQMEEAVRSLAGSTVGAVTGGGEGMGEGVAEVELPLGLEYLIELMKGIVLPSLTS